MTTKMRRVVNGTAGLCLTAAGVLAIAGCGHKSPAESHATRDGDPPGASSPSAVPVETVTVTRQHLERVSDSYPAEVYPFEETAIRAKISGYVQGVYADIGDKVFAPTADDNAKDRLMNDTARMIQEKKVLAQIWVPEMLAEHDQKQALLEQANKAAKVAEAQVATARALVQEASAGLIRAQGNHRYWELEHENVMDLVKGKIIEEQREIEARNKLESAKAALKEAQAKVESAKAAQQESQAKLAEAMARAKVARANLNYVQTMLQYTRILAPFDGVVSKLNLYRGAFLDPKINQRPIFTITRTDKLRIVVDIPEKDAGYLNLDKNKPNNLVRVKFDALPDLPAKDKPFAWRITRFAPVLGAGKKVRVELHVDNPGGRLFPGMYGHANVILEDKPQALTLPVACISQDDRGAFVWAVVDGKAKRQRVTIGMDDGSKAEITSGLRHGDQVTSRGIEGLRDGQLVSPQKSLVGKK